MKTKKNLSVFSFCIASIGAIISNVNAATINLTDTLASVGLEYTMGYGPVVVEDATDGVTDGLEAAVIQLGGSTMGFYPNNPKIWHEIHFDSRASGSIAYDDLSSDLSIFGTSSAEADFTLVELAQGTAVVPSALNYISLKFEVVDETVDYTLTFDNDVDGFLTLQTLDGIPVVNMSDGQEYAGILDPGIYLLDTWLSFSVTAIEGSRSGTNSFTLTFPGSTLGVTPVPVPAAVWLFGSGLLGLIGVARGKKAA